MKELRYTLVSDGSSDRALLPVLSWLLDKHQVRCPIQAEWADLRRLPNPPKTLELRIEKSLEFYPCELLFVHRDAESNSYTRRKAEIDEVLAAMSLAYPPAVCVVPVRMLEAWLLFDEAALRRASGNPNGKTPLQLPSPATLEEIIDPKMRLYELLTEASELKGRRRQSLRVSRCARKVSDYIDDFGLLRTLPAFRALEADLEETITRNRWADPLFIPL